MRRRLLLGSIAMALAATSVAATSATGGALPAVQRPVDPRLAGINHVVVIYEENHSFDNLYGLWPGADGLSPLTSPTQVDQAGAPYTCLKQNDSHLTSPSPLPATCADPRGFSSAFTNNPFSIDNFIPQNQNTEDLVHRYYQEQYQIDGGKMDKVVTGSDAIGLSEGYYNTAALPVYQYLTGRDGPPSAVADHFFHAAFGGSFLNHQWLIAAQTPTFANALNDGSANDLHSVVDANGMPTSYPLYTSPLGSQAKDKALTASCAPPAGRPATPANVVCGDYAVNTVQPASQPYSPTSNAAQRLPLLKSANIGDELSAKGVSWAWYSGGWDNAAGNTSGLGWTNGSTPGACADPAHNGADVYPYCGDKLFQYHHQPFNYYANYAEGAAGRSHLQDEQNFLSQAAAGALPAVSFVKPLGEENEHPGYTDVTQGEVHLVNLLKAIKASPDWSSTLVVVTYDEHGGFGDHVAPLMSPGVSDHWGPGERVPSLIVSPQLINGVINSRLAAVGVAPKRPNSVVDHTSYDTTSILATIEHRFGVAPMSTRDASVRDFTSLLLPRT